jgi:hypothetical protein
VSNEVVHDTDTFTTFAQLAGARVPNDRPIEGVDQADFFLANGNTPTEMGFPAYVADCLQAVKWRNWKVHFSDPEAASAVDLIVRLTDAQTFNYFATRMSGSTWCGGTHG